MSKWIGYAVSVNCGEPLGCYQGTIQNADGSTITLTKAFRNGFPYPKSKVTLNAADIKDLKIIEEESGAGGSRAHSTVAVGERRGDALRPGAGRERARRRDEACFGARASPPRDDFDFEGNLALFDRAALREEMRGARPDLLRPAAAHLRPDQSALPPRERPPPARLPPELSAGAAYATDAGARVPCAAAALRRRLWLGLRRLGVADVADALLARAVADAALRLAGGARRLESGAAPRVGVLAGAHRVGAAALHAARLLATHGALAAAHAAPAAPGSEAARALAAASLGGVELADAPGALGACDVLVVALHDPAAGGGGAGEAGALAAAGGARGAVLSVEPPPEGWAGVRGRAVLQAGLAGAAPRALGRLLLANVGLPPRLLADAGAEGCAPPFGASSLLALHPPSVE